MKVKGLDGKTHNINFSRNKRHNCSDGHRKARTILKELFPMESVFEEVFLPGCGLYADFLLPNKLLMIEVQGPQHGEYSSFFHGDKSGFAKSLGRDSTKKKFCDINGITLVELNYGNESSWERTITEAVQS